MRTLESAMREAAESLTRESERIPDRRWNPPRKRLLARGVMVGVAAAAAVLVVFAVPIWLSLLPQDDVAETPPAVEAPAEPVADAGTTQIGEAVSDAEFRAAFPFEDLVSGSARRLASSDVPGLGLLEVYAVQQVSVDASVDFTEPMVCIRHPVGAVCGPDLDLAELRIGGGSGCPGSLIFVLGMGDDASLLLEFTDGTEVEVVSTLGAAVWGWNDDEVGLAGIALSGADEATVAEFERLRTEHLPDLPTQPCN